MLSKPILSKHEISCIMNAAIKEAHRHNWVVTISIVDDGGHPLALERLDGCAPIAAYISMEKARTAALGKRESGEYELMINNGRTAFLSAPNLAGMLEGGIPILVGNHMIGAVGVSGVKADQDAQIARTGVAAVAKLINAEVWNATNPCFR